MNRFDPYENTSGPLDNYRDSLELQNEPLNNYSDPMTRVDPFADNPGLFNEIINWSHDPMNKPQNQNKYFFSDGKTYYEQICKMLKLMAVFKDAFNQIYDNEDEIHEAWENFVENLSATATAGDEASVTLTWTDESVQFEFVMPRGQKGDKGDQGDPGQDGVSITNITFNADYTMTITLSNGNSYTSPSLKGEKGDPGEGLEILDIYATLAELEQAHPTGQPGDAYLIGTDPNYTLYIWSASQNDWLPAGSLTAPSPSTSTPLMDGTASTGSENAYSRGDHVHPTDTSRASASDLTALSGTVTTLGTTVGTISGNVTQLQTDMSQAQGDITRLQSDMTDAQGDISQLQTDVTGISGDVTQLQTDVSALDGQVDTLSDDLDALEDIVTGSNDLDDQQFLYREAPTDHDTIARINSIKGNTVSFNQLVQNGNFADTSYWRTGGSGSSFSVQDNVVTVTTVNQWSGLQQYPGWDIVNGHVYYFSCYLKKNNADDTINLYTGSGIFTESTLVTPSDTNWNKIQGIYHAISSVNTFRPSFDNSTASTTYQLKYMMFRDLTLMGIDNLTTTAEVEAYISSHLGNLDYFGFTLGTLIPFAGTGLKTTGKNQYNNATGLKNLYLNQNTGSLGSGGTTYVADILPNKQYTLSGTRGNRSLFGLSKKQANEIGNGDVVENILSVSLPYTFNSSDYHSVVYYSNTDYDATLGTDVQLEFGSTATTYEPYTSNTLSLPTLTYFPFGEDSAGTAHDELIPNSDVYKRMGIVDLGNLDYTYTNGVFRTSLPNSKMPPNYNTVANILCARYIADTSYNVNNLVRDMSIAIHTTNNQLWIADSHYTDASTFKSSLANTYLVFELATPLHNYGVVDLGSLTYNYDSTNQRFVSTTQLTGAKPNSSGTQISNLVCPLFIATSTALSSTGNNVIALGTSDTLLRIKTSDYGTDPAVFKSAMSGVYLLYELITPVSPSSMEDTYPVWNGGTEQILPINDSTPDTAPIIADFSYMSTDEAIQYLYDHISASVQAELDDLDDRVTDTETDISTMQTDISNLQTDLSTLYVIEEFDYGFSSLTPGQNVPYSGPSRSVTGYIPVGIIGSKIYRMIDDVPYYANGVVLDYAFCNPTTYDLAYNIMNATSDTISSVRLTLYVLYIKDNGGN